MSSWLLQSPPGLAQALKREMIFAGAIERKQDPFIKRQRNHDLLMVGRAKNPDAFARLRIAEMVMRCPLFGRFKISKTQLQTMADELGKLGPRRLVAQVAGRHFDRRDLTRWLGKEMAARGYEFTDDEAAEEVWMICIDELYYFGIPVIKSRAGEGRDERAVERHGALPPPVAAALAFAGLASNDDVILDPVCGSGTCLAEAHAYAPTAPLIGIDIDAEAVKIARANLAAAEPTGLTLLNADSRRSGLDRRDVSLVIANLPFGRQFGDKSSNPELYRDILAECLRLAHPEKWRAVVLTSDLDSLGRALGELATLERKELFRVKIRGELASAYLLKVK